MSERAAPDLLSGTAYFRHALQTIGRDWRAMFDRRAATTNVAAGLTVTMVALPLNVALAIAAGLPPSAGLVAGAVAGVIGALFGGARLSVTGPEVALAPITLEIVGRHGLAGLTVATCLAGLFQIVLGACRVGHLVHAIPLPVVGGFLAAVGLLVFDAQLPRLLGLPAELRSLTSLGSEHLAQIAPSALCVGVGVVLLLVLLPRVQKRLPAPLCAMLLAVAAVSLLGLPLSTVPPFEAAFPMPQLPAFAGVQLTAILPEALALALLASIDSLLCAVSLDAMTGGERTRTDQELVAQGLANVASSFFGGMPVAAAVVRSVAAHEAGATNRLAPLTQALALALVLSVLSPLLVHVPLVALAAILLVVGYRLIQWRSLLSMWRMARFEAAIFVATALGILCTDFVFGVALGVIAALVHFARQQRSMVCARALDDAPTAGSLRLLRLEGPLFFGAQRDVQDAVGGMHDAAHLVVDLSAVSTVDLSGATALATALGQLARRGTRVQVSTFGSPVHPLLHWAFERHAADALLHVEQAEPAGMRKPVRAALRSMRRDQVAEA